MSLLDLIVLSRMSKEDIERIIQEIAKEEREKRVIKIID